MAIYKLEDLLAKHNVTADQITTFGSEANIKKSLSEVESKKESYLSRVGGQYDKALQRIASGIESSADEISGGISKLGQGDIVGGLKDVVKGEARAGLRTAGSIAGAAFAPVLEAPGIKQVVEGAVGAVAEVPIAQQIASKGMELVKKYPNASKDIEDIINIATLGLGSAAEKPIQSVVSDVAQKAVSGIDDVASGIAKAGSNAVEKIVPKSDEIMNRVARLTPKQATTFERLAGKTHGEYLRETGNFGTPDEIIKKEAAKFTESIKSVDDTLATLPGTYTDGSIADAITGLKEKALATSSENVKSPILKKVVELENKFNNEGLTMSEINDLKRLYERHVKLGYNKTLNPDKVEKATFVDDALREWQVNKAKELGFENISELNKQTQLSKFIIDNLGDQVIGKTGLNNVGLTDWIMLSGGDPTAVGGFLTKKFFSSKSVQSKIAEMLNKGEVKGQIKPKITPSKTQPQSKLETGLEKAYTETIPQSKAKSNSLSTLEEEARKYKNAEEFVKAQPSVYHGTFKPKELSFEQKGTLYTTTQEGASTYGNKNVQEFYQTPGRTLTVSKDLMPKEWDKIIAQAKKDGYNYVKGTGTDFNGKKIPVTVALNSEKTLVTKSQLTDIYNKAVGKKVKK